MPIITDSQVRYPVKSCLAFFLGCNLSNTDGTPRDSYRLHFFSDFLLGGRAAPL